MISRYINKAKDIKKDFLNKRVFFGYPKALIYTLSPYTHIGNSQRHADILRYLENEYADIIRKYKSLDSISSNPNQIADNSPIWVLWLQGEDCMPEIVRKCVNSIRRNAQKHPVHLLSKDNISDYVDDCFDFKRVNEGNYKISRTHYSDLLRMQLLSKYGGLWIDSTVYMSKPMPKFHSSIFTISHNGGGKRHVLNGSMWSAWLWGGAKDAIFPRFAYEMFTAYWGKENHLIDYYLIDYLAAVAFRNFSNFQKEVLSLPKENPYPNKLMGVVNKPYIASELNAILDGQIFHKLNWRMNIADGDVMFKHI